MVSPLPVVADGTAANVYFAANAFDIAIGQTQIMAAAMVALPIHPRKLLRLCPERNTAIPLGLPIVGMRLSADAAH